MSSNIETVLQEKRVFPPAPAFVKQANISGMDAYRKLVAEAERDFEGFWARLARENLLWSKPFTKTLDESKAPFFRWFHDGELNASHNCLDKHLKTQPDKIAIIFEADDGKVTKITYRQLHAEVCRFANALKARGIKKGERVLIYMPMSIQAVVAMQACARIAATHSVVFGGFSAKSVQERIIDAGAVAVITADGQFRGGREIALKPVVDEALGMGGCEAIKNVIVYKRSGSNVPMKAGRDIWWEDAVKGQADTCEPTFVDAEHPLFILYTSGSTGKPKGIQHSTGGYLLWCALTMKWVFDNKPGDVFWCTADVGWVTGHSYITYGPLAVGATEVVFEGVPTYPDAGRFWKIIQDHKVNVFYTAPTAIRSLIKAGGEMPKKYDLSSLRILGTVGEPINPEAWMWYHETIGGSRCPIVDTWWQTETGGHMITPLPGAIPTKPGTATLPFFGVDAAIVDDEGKELPPNQGGKLVIRKPWPAMLRGIWGDKARYKQTYWSEFKGMYFAGDGARRDKDGYFWIVGRIDDVLNVAGHRLGTAEVESALVSHPSVAEAAVVGRPDELKGQAVVCFVTLKQGVEAKPELRDTLKKHVRTMIGPVATPDEIRFTEALPKTRSGKIMRRLLKEIAAGKTISGDTTTLEDFSILAKLSSAEE